MIARLWGWYLDYWFVAWWQLRALFSSRVPRDFERGDRAPVLLLAGVYEPWYFLRRIGHRLNDAGHPVHVVGEIGYNRASIVDVAVLAARYLEEHDLRGVVLVAHSKGGLVGKQLMATTDRVAARVAVATPFGGSSLARLVPVRTIRAFDPRDVTITTLASNLALNSRITSLYPRFDPHIPGGSRLEGATNVEYPLVGHFRLLGDARVIEGIESAVASVE